MRTTTLSSFENKAAPRRVCARVPLLVESQMESLVPQPVTLGVPLPRGAINHGVKLVLFDSEGSAYPCQGQTLARHSDGSVKWLLVDTMLPSLSKGISPWSLVSSDEARNDSRHDALVVHESNDAIDVNARDATFHLSRSAMPLSEVRINGRPALAVHGVRTSLTTCRGKVTPPRINGMTVESRGPIRATVRYDGEFVGPAPCRFVCRVCFFAGTGMVRVRLTIHNPRRARHRGGLWDLGDPGSILFRELALELAIPGAQGQSITWRAEPGLTAAQTRGPLEIHQDSSGGENWISRNHIDRTGSVPCKFRGYRVSAAGCNSVGLRANPDVSIRGAGSALSVAVPEFWQQFPKALTVENGRLRVVLFPAQFGSPHELQGGEQKTHTVWFHFAGDDSTVDSALTWVHSPACVRATPEWYADAGAISYLMTRNRGTEQRFETLMSDAVDGPNNLFARREIIDEYGWRNYGEIYADHENAYYPGMKPLVSHYNNQYDIIYGSLLQFFRTGDRRWFELADPLARHVIDIDIYHTNEDRAAYNGGLFWHTDHYRDAASCTHRGYSRANRPARGSYGGGPCNEHNYTTGLLHYYYVTGDPQAGEAVVSLANWVIAMDDGARTILGVLDNGPTGIASSTCQRTYHGPGRGCGNSVNALLDGWLLTGARHYLENAEALIRRVIHPVDDIVARDLRKAEQRWSYTVFLTVLARYLKLKTEAGEHDSMYAYAQASLLHYAEWMVEQERSYFDHRENLKFPTETWAAQEFRKANVLKLASQYADDSLRSRLRQRGDELTEQAWIDLLSFDRPATTRALAILFTEGVKNAFFQCRGELNPAHTETDYDFGEPESFVTQRRRVLAQLRSARGLATSVMRMTNVSRWARFFTPKMWSSVLGRDDYSGAQP